MIDQREALSPLLSITGSVETLPTRMVHIWPCKSLDERAAAPASASKMGIWPPPGSGTHLLSLRSTSLHHRPSRSCREIPSILIAGASRGRGLELARKYAADGWRVYAACRSPDTADRVRALNADDLSLHRSDVAETVSIVAPAEERQGGPLDIVFAAAGINEPDGVSPENVTDDD